MFDEMAAEIKEEALFVLEKLMTKEISNDLLYGFCAKPLPSKLNLKNIYFMTKDTYPNVANFILKIDSVEDSIRMCESDYEGYTSYNAFSKNEINDQYGYWG